MEASVYTVSQEDRLTEVNDAFLEFASHNGAAMDRETILGRSIWDFITDEGLAAVYRRLMTTVRETGQPFCFPMRCDSPDVRRHMTMTLAPRFDGGIEFIVELDSEVTMPLAILKKGHSGHRLMCSACDRIEIEEDWIPLEAALLRQLIDVGAEAVFFDVCDDCRLRSVSLRHPSPIHQLN